MAETHVVSALVNKRAEIAGQITRFEQQLGQFRADLTHVDATIRLFAPDLEPDAIPAKVIPQRLRLFAHQRGISSYTGVSVSSVRLPDGSGVSREVHAPF